MLHHVLRYREIIGCHVRKMHLLNEKAFINGEWVSACNNKEFQVRNPSNGKIIGKVPDMCVEDTASAINAAHEAFPSWQNTTPKQRATILRNWYELMVENRENIAKIITAEAGKPLTEAKGEVTYGNSFVEYYAEEATRIDGEIVSSPDPRKKLLIEKQAIGVAALITPWNFPHAMITRKASAALAAGCTCVIKPAEDTPFTALALMELAQQAGIPNGVLNVVTGDRANAPEIGNSLCTSPKIAGISFTGSTQVGKILYKQCASGVKRLGLELGGNAPFIVYKSAKIDNAVRGAMASKFRNCGQACVSANRFLIQDDIYDEFVVKLTSEIEKLVIGDGNECGVHLGPLINRAQFDKVRDMVDDAVTKGAQVLTGGTAASEYGELFYKPTVLTNLTDDMRVYNEEVFGPVVNIIRFKTEEESLQIANSTERGLAGYFFTEDVSQIFRVSKQLQVGMVGVNEGVISAAEAPFGGIKESGLGREGSHHGIDDFTYIKYTCVGNLQL